ncbi:MAG: hypothetical protein IPN26_14480 [Bacteroidetes bacterium]|nr:hypothetical protein [Bacteroidota bacterium]
MSEALDKQEHIKTELLDKLVKVDDAIEFTEEEKQNDQIEIETELIQKQIEIDEAIDNQDVGKIKELQKEVEAIKRHFNSLEFEIELKRLFDDTANDLWIISPWIKNATFKRIPFFEKYLKKGGRIFIAYSEPEEPGQVMAYDEPLNKLLDLEKGIRIFTCINYWLSITRMYGSERKMVAIYTIPAVTIFFHSLLVRDCRRLDRRK